MTSFPPRRLGLLKEKLSPTGNGAAVRSYDFQDPVITLACTNALMAIFTLILHGLSNDSNACRSRLFKMESLVDSLWLLITPPHHAYVAPRWRKAWMTTDRKCFIPGCCERVSPHKSRRHYTFPLLSSSISSLSSTTINI